MTTSDNSYRPIQCLAGQPRRKWKDSFCCVFLCVIFYLFVFDFVCFRVGFGSVDTHTHNSRSAIVHFLSYHLQGHTNDLHTFMQRYLTVLSDMTLSLSQLNLWFENAHSFFLCFNLSFTLRGWWSLSPSLSRSLFFCRLFYRIESVLCFSTVSLICRHEEPTVIRCIYNACMPHKSGTMKRQQSERCLYIVWSSLYAFIHSPDLPKTVFIYYKYSTILWFVCYT